MFHRILVGVDDSSAAKAALGYLFWDLVVVGDRLNRRSPTPVLVVHEDPDTEPLAAGVGRAQLRVA